MGIGLRFTEEDWERIERDWSADILASFRSTEGPLYELSGGPDEARDFLELVASEDISR